MSPPELNIPEAEATQSQNLPGSYGTATAQLNLAGVESVIDEALQLDEKFLNVVTHTKAEFSGKPAKFLGELRRTLLTLHVSTRFKHLHYLKSERERIMKANSVDEIFMILEDYWDYTNYELLQYLVQKFGESGLKKEMNEYVKELEEFEKKTTIQVNDSAAFNNLYHKELVHNTYKFSKVDIRLPKDPKVYTLYEVRQLKKSVAKKACLEPYVILQNEVSYQSVLISLVLPCSALELIFAALDEEFLETHQIASVIIDNKPLEEYTEEYVKVRVNGEV